ncbi:MAG: putative rane protein [Pseudonocardiales bacterium]|nr:putative rane protein [Pseudonocardiales bacterium]
MGVDDEHQGQVLDYRMSFAAERTYLAYVRTGLALLAAGVAIVGALPDAGAINLRRAIGIGLVVIGGTLLAYAPRRWAAVTRAMRAGKPLPPTRLMTAVSLLLVVAAVLAGVVVVLA